MSQILMDPAHLRTYLLTVTKWWINIEFRQGHFIIIIIYFLFLKLRFRSGENILPQSLV